MGNWDETKNCYKKLIKVKEKMGRSIRKCYRFISLKLFHKLKLINKRQNHENLFSEMSNQNPNSDNDISIYDLQTLTQQSNSAALLHLDLSKIIIEKEGHEKSVFDMESSRSTARNTIENDVQTFFLDATITKDMLDNEYYKLTNEYTNLGEKYLLIMQRSDFNQHIIDNMKSQEQDYARLNLALQTQIIQIETILQSFQTDIYESKIPNLIQKTQKNISQKSREISGLKQEILKLNDLLSKAQFEKNKLLKQSKELANNIARLQYVKRNEKTMKFEEAALEAKMKYKNINKKKDEIYTIKKHISSEYSRLTDVLTELQDLSTFIETQKRKNDKISSRIESMKQKTKVLHDKSTKANERSSKLLKNFARYSKIHGKNEKTMQKLKGKMDELTKSYKVETKLNKLLPNLIKQSQECDQITSDIEKQHTKIDHMLEERQSEKDLYDQQMLKMNEILHPLEERIKQAKSEEEDLSLIINDDSFNLMDSLIINHPKSDKEIALEKKIKIVKNQSLKLLNQIKEIRAVLSKQEVSRKSLIRIMKSNYNTHSHLNQIHENNNGFITKFYHDNKINQLKQDIRSLQIRIETKKDVLRDKKVQFYEKSSLFVHTIHNNNPKEIASAQCLDCDPTTKSLVLKKHDPYSGVEHEKEIVDLRAKYRVSALDICPYCDNDHRLVNYAVI
ncbi:hypothetical protein TRFO_10518 [Tritrichomonas foetus]|uniref:Uncharacterized protein n=1 Tax=Tritrichomonas foetus TaxID=1144522 RepID=A0A1J4J9P1_9EUKA|nr:hypothetical protein TRFO_10518 [Tritrichomonas foetus]|eukprot:OHS95385.1 hypothetical protein TRFO_10518 [Tritrichomonas foetus]